MTSGKVLAAAVMAFSLAVIPKASAATLYTDNFEGDALGGAAAGWTSPNADTVLTVEDDGTGNHVLDVNSTASTGSRPLVVPLTSPTTLADGDSIQLSFDVRVATAIASIPVADRGFRFALFNSEGTSSTGDDLGYIGRVDTGVPATTTFDLSGAFAGTAGIFGVSGSAKHTSTTNVLAALDDNAVHTITVLLQRTGADVFGTATFTNGATTVKIGAFDDTLASTNSTYTFDELAIGDNAAATIEYTLDNVNVVNTLATVATPEPASLGLLGMGVAGMMLRRRKA